MIIGINGQFAAYLQFYNGSAYDCQLFDDAINYTDKQFHITENDTYFYSWNIKIQPSSMQEEHDHSNNSTKVLNWSFNHIGGLTLCASIR